MSDIQENRSLVRDQVKSESKLDSKEDVPREEPLPEGGWGWVVVTAAFLVICVIDGVGYSFGIYLLPLLDDKIADGRGILSMAGSLQVGCYGFSSPLVAFLVDKFGARKCCMLGAVISALGLLTASFATGIVTLLIGYSIITGLGFGLMYLPACCIPTQHFTKRRSLATGLVLCAAGVGTFAVAPLAQELLAVWGWRGSMRGLSLLCLACVACGAVITPGMHGKEGRPGATASTEVSSCLGKVLGAGLANSHLLPVFFLCSFADVLASCALYVPFAHLPPAAEDAGLSATQGAMLVSIIGLTNTVGRIVAGWLADQPCVSPLIMTCSVVSGVAPLVYVFSVCTQLWEYIVLAAFFGFLTGCWVSVAPATLTDLLGANLLTQAFGFLSFFRGFAALSGPPIAGAVVDVTGSSEAALLVSGGIFTGAAVTYVITILVIESLLEKKPALGTIRFDENLCLMFMH